jgi:GT2 family glycosyltransferase
MPLVDFVVCTRNNRDIIEGTLEAVFRQTFSDLSCTVVDGMSSDGTVELIRERFPSVQVIVKTEDSGPAVSRNLGMARGAAPLIVLLDSDVRLAPDWTERQLELLRDETIGIGCGRLLMASDTSLLHAAYGVMNRFGVSWEGGYGRPAAEYGEKTRCIYSLTAAMMVRRSAFERVGGFDEPMFFVHEDVDFGWRMNQAGYDVVFNPLAEAVHEVHGTVKMSSMSALIMFHAWKNRLRMLLVNYEAHNLIRYGSVYLLLFVMDALIFGRTRIKMQSLLWNAKNLGGTRERRRFVQANRKVRDRDLWSLFQRGFRGPGIESHTGGK